MNSFKVLFFLLIVFCDLSVFEILRTYVLQGKMFRKAYTENYIKKPPGLKGLQNLCTIRSKLSTFCSEKFN